VHRATQAGNPAFGSHLILQTAALSFGPALLIFSVKPDIQKIMTPVTNNIKRTERTRSAFFFDPMPLSSFQQAPMIIERISLPRLAR
jgi:hypothetical protein